MDMQKVIPANELIRERDFYRAKLQSAKSRIKTLEFDLSELQKRDFDLSKKLAEVSNKSNNGYRPKYRKQA